MNFTHNSDTLNLRLLSIFITIHPTDCFDFFILVQISQSNTKMSVQQPIMDGRGRCLISLEEIINIKPAFGTVQNN